MELNALSSNKSMEAASQPLVSVESPYKTTTEIGYKRSRFNLYLASVASNIASFSIGNCFSWTSPTFAKLLVPKNDILEITKAESSWIGSLIAFGAIFGPFVAGGLVNRIGRKWTITLSVGCIIISWAVLLFSRSVELMCAARVLAGVGGGIIYTVVPIYVAEIAEDDIRGALGSLMSFFICSGFLLEYVTGPFVSYSTLILISLVAPILFLLVFPLFMPETPYYLLRRGQDAEAFKSLAWLRQGDTADEINRELHLMKVTVNSSLQESGTLLDLFSTAGCRRGLLISCGLAAGQQLSGINVVIFYSESIFSSTGSNLSPAVCSIIIAVILILSSGAAPPLVRFFGMKWLLIVSALGMGVFQGILGLYFYLQHLKINLTAFDWMPITSLVGYIILYAIGFGPLPWAVMAEMFPTNVKAVGSALTASVCWVFGFLMTKYFVDICSSIGEFISFWMFTFFCFLMILFTFFLLPDTRGKSFDEIQDILNSRQRKT